MSMCVTRETAEFKCFETSVLLKIVAVFQYNAEKRTRVYLDYGTYTVSIRNPRGEFRA